MLILGGQIIVRVNCAFERQRGSRAVLHEVARTYCCRCKVGCTFLMLTLLLLPLCWLLLLSLLATITRRALTVRPVTTLRVLSKLGDMDVALAISSAFPSLHFLWKSRSSSLSKALSAIYTTNRKFTGQGVRKGARPRLRIFCLRYQMYTYHAWCDLRT